MFASIAGHKGALFPFVMPSDQNMTLTLSLFRLHTFNSSLLAANMWDYWRSTKDTEWLKEVGYPVISEIANFIRSCYTRSEKDGRFTLSEGVALDGIAVTHDTFSVNSSMLAFRAAIEASYVLRRSPKLSWKEVIQGVRTIYLDTKGAVEPELKWVYRKHLNDPWTPTFDPQATQVLQTDDQGRVPWRTLADPLFILTPAQAQIAHPNGKNLRDATRNNLAYYEPRLGLNLGFGLG